MIPTTVTKTLPKLAARFIMHLRHLFRLSPDSSQSQAKLKSYPTMRFRTLTRTRSVQLEPAC